MTHLNVFPLHILPPVYGIIANYRRLFIHSIPNELILNSNPGFSVKKKFEALGYKEIFRHKK